MAADGFVSSALLRRLRDDTEEMQQDPYPNAHLHLRDSKLREACLILIPEGYTALHFTVQFPVDYPKAAPKVTVQGTVIHPNVLDHGYICPDMLNKKWTPAYSLKAVAIQLLSFFSSDSLEQDYGNEPENLELWRDEHRQFSSQHNYHCTFCNFGSPDAPHLQQQVSSLMEIDIEAKGSTPASLPFLPPELWLGVFEFLDTKDLVNFSQAFPEIHDLLCSQDFIRTRELQCFCLKTNFLHTKLGVGVAVSGGNRAAIHSEFDLISLTAYNLNVRKSVQGVPFKHWLPLPLNLRHWGVVRADADRSLDIISKDVNLGKIEAVYVFMNNIVVQFSKDTDTFDAKKVDRRSTLTHASEKAVEAYFALFHLLLCMATEQPIVVNDANRMVHNFRAGPRTKARFPDLGILLAAALISDAGLTEQLISEIIEEAILRNVVWMLNEHPDLAYIEPDAVSKYRLLETFNASKTSYRLLMFLKLFSSTARVPGKSLAELCDALHKRHGAPPHGTSAAMVQEIHEIRDMGIRGRYSMEEFAAMLNGSITKSVEVGYSAMPVSQSQLYLLRVAKDGLVGRSAEVWIGDREKNWLSQGGRVGQFFPRDPRHAGRGGRPRGRGGRYNR
ncbi:hypothetical protein P154DRAFT_592902 [Amniculicola lignicola CBS 123094]|uniref:UBC core domain-containing protein n=1 Tax=Amniculicola lignicola CBS 123094 TaxID=1392246 RepID=A0A6A5X3K0_9PLEO|nr:hypothetical protein P154DRAFT_592902 [Amniculicola lignicola CBS 123094]